MFARALAAALWLAASCWAADPQWVKARLGSFETISDGGRQAAIQGLSQFEQFRFALGVVMGKADLQLDPPLRILVFRNAQELEAQGFRGLRMGRDRLMACTVGEGQLPPDLVRALTRQILENNFSSMAGPTERGLETFFSTVQSNAVHVTWGAPPPAGERTREWALLHRLITQPDYSGRAHIYLHNLASGMDSNGALRSMSEDPAKFNAEVDRYFAAGVYAGVQAPSRPLNPERDFSTTILTSDEGRLMRADLLTAGAEAEYRELLKAGKHVAEDNEGLGILAMRAGDAMSARNYMEAARRAGTKNASALTAYAALEKDSGNAIAILHEALSADAKYAPAHWALGERIEGEPMRRLAEWKQAVALAPRNYEWWGRYAQLCADQKQYAEAGRAWVAAAQAAPDAAARERYLALRGQIDELRLNDEDAIRRRELAAKTAEMERLKAQARKELADLEARANSHPLSKEEAARVVEYDEIDSPDGTKRLTGMLVRVDCLGKELRLEVKDEFGKTTKLLIADPEKVEMTGGTATLACGAQKTRRVRLTWRARVDGKKTTVGDVTGIEFR